MKYISAIKGSFIALIIFIIAVILIPGKGSSREVEIILTISTFLFAILSGFFISRLNTRYDQIREALATEDAYWLALYKTGMFFGKNFLNKLRELVDKYIMVSFDFFGHGHYYKHNAVYFHQVYEELNKVKIPPNSKAMHMFDDAVNLLKDIEVVRNQNSVLSRERVTKGQWTVLLFLAGIIIFSIFFIKTTQIYSQIITVLLSTVLILVLLILRDLQELKLSGELIVTESGQEIFENIGKLRYYPEVDIKAGTVRVPGHIKKYRLGLHQPGEKPKIKIVTNK